MTRNERSTLVEGILAQVRCAKSEVALRPVDFVEECISAHESSRPAGSVALDFACDRHGGRLMRLWMSPQTGNVTFGAEGVKGAWNTDSSGPGAVVVTCTWPGCCNTARLTNDWLMESLRHVWADFEAGKGLPIAWFPLSQVGSSSR